ncbi:hypothetical protein N9183_01190 [bacterium]|nr:hypothetical protein [bacterium]
MTQAFAAEGFKWVNSNTAGGKLLGRDAYITPSFYPSRGSWLLTGPVGANGYLKYQTARDAAEYARWDARDTGGTIDVFNQQGRLYRSIVIEPAELADSGFVLPSV